MGKVGLRPLLGVVTKIFPAVQIETESGLTVELVSDELLVGDSVWVGYDFTNNRVRTIQLAQDDLQDRQKLVIGEEPREEVVDGEEAGWPCPNALLPFGEIVP